MLGARPDPVGLNEYIFIHLSKGKEALKDPFLACDIEISASPQSPGIENSNIRNVQLERPQVSWEKTQPGGS